MSGNLFKELLAYYVARAQSCRYDSIMVSDDSTEISAISKNITFKKGLVLVLAFIILELWDNNMSI